jgi:hypothetical protein
MNRSEALALTDPREMRQELMRSARTGRPLLDGGHYANLAMSSPILRNVYCWAEAQGLSGEDLHTALAWNLAVHCQDVEERFMQDPMLRPAPRVVPAPNLPKF